ncbi:hypothetical protein SFRURICE_001258 [Spodoptera frugiperda]|nr:hypothetical protein SFRURICE_001258 [Spodoptera frugiperda]
MKIQLSAIIAALIRKFRKRLLTAGRNELKNAMSSSKARWLVEFHISNSCITQACSMQASMQASKQAASKQAASKQAACKQACSMQASIVSVTAPELRGSGGPTRANRRRRLSLTTAASACWPASPASLSRGGSLIAACSSARGPPRPSAPTRF